MTESAVKNVAILVKSGVAALQQAGWDEARIIAQVPYLVDEAIKFLTAKA